MDITCYWIAWLTRMSSERWHVRSSLQISATIPSSQNHFKTLHTPPNPIKSNLRSNPFLFIVHRIPNSPDPSSIRFSRFLFFVSHFLPEREVLALISRESFGTWWVRICGCIVVKACFELSSVLKESCSGGTVRERTKSWTVGSYVAWSESSLLVILVRASFCYQFYFMSFNFLE